MSALLLLLLTTSTPDLRLDEAERLIAARETDAAIDLYRALIAEGVDGAGVRYNLGTLLLDRGELGAAMVELRAARRFDPQDDDVQHNLDAALALRSDRLAGTPGADPWRALGEAVPPNAARIAVAAPLALLGLCLVVLALCNFSVRWSRGRGLLQIVRASTLALCALSAAGAVVWGARWGAERRREAVVLPAETPARKGPTEDAEVAFTAHAGLLGDIVDESGGFRRLRFENGLEAWLEEDALGQVPQVP